ncbi:MAG TPA: hypothetical protein VL832_19085 [Puia sp.]|nr:hypothetical protein [Puia sp.]
MKLKNVYRPMMAVAVAGMVIFAACKKSNSTDNSNTSDADVQTQSDDQSRVSSENDALTNDVATSLDAQAGFSVTGVATRGDVQVDGPHQVASSICDATIMVDTTVNPRTLTITYNGSNCAGTRTRTGTVVVSMAAGTRWSNKGAVVTVSIQNLKITRVADGKSITINGTHTYTNVSGGSLINLASLGSITHTVTSDDMTITFDNGSKRSWHIARQRVYSYVNGIVVTESGLHSDGGTTGITEWGTNRFGNSFETVFTTPVVVAQSCNWRLTAGEIEVIRPAVTVTLTLGLDAQGNPTDCPGLGFYYFKLVWQGAAGKTYTFILPY